MFGRHTIIMAIHTPTLEDYKETLEFAFNNDMCWSSGLTDISENYWYSDEYMEETCILIDTCYLLRCSPKYYVKLYYAGPILDKFDFYSEFYKENNKELIERYGLI